MLKSIVTTISNKRPSTSNKPAPPVQVVHFVTGFPERPVLPVRQNDLLLITWFIKGSGLLTVDFYAQPVETNSLFFIQPHTVYSLDTQKETNLEGWSLSINENYLHEYGSNLSELIFELRNISKLKIPKENRQKIEQLFYFLQTELLASSPGAEPIINSYLTILLSEFKKLSDSPSTYRRSHDPRYDEFLDLINKEFREIKDIETYAGRIHISSKQLNRICKEVAGRTAGQLLDARIHVEASRLLHYTNRSVKEISYELGFTEPSYFVKFYRRISKKTPHQYRQLISGPLPGSSENYTSRDLSLIQLYDN